MWVSLSNQQLHEVSHFSAPTPAEPGYATNWKWGVVQRQTDRSASLSSLSWTQSEDTRRFDRCTMSWRTERLSASVRVTSLGYVDTGNLLMASTARLLRSWVRIPPGGRGCFVCCECCVLSGRGILRRADHSSRGVLPIVERRCVWSRNITNEEAMTRVGSQRHRKYIYIVCN
jgi:hypothetical protein